MCKRLFKSLKIKMDNFKLRYELAGADEEIARIRQENEKLKNKITELEENLKNSIIYKFKIGQEVFIIIQDIVRTTSINSFRVFENNELSYYCKYVDGQRMYLELDEDEVFATQEEAEEKLKQLGDK